MSSVSKIRHRETEIWVIDYSGAKEQEMMALVTALRDAINSVEQPARILSVFNGNYVTPTFMRHAEQETLEGLRLIEKMAFIGLSPTQEWILKGYNLFLKRNYKSFPTREAALDYLAVKAPD
jgi:hypothetical protein